MKVLLPLAGLGARLRPLTYTRPKPLLNIAGKPLLGHVLDALNDLPVEEVTFIVGHLGEQIREWAAANCRYPARFIEQKELLGQAHALWLAHEGITGPILIIFVDTIFEADLVEIPKVKADGVIYVKEVADPRRFGVAKVTGPDNTVVRLIEKPDGFEDRLAVGGIYHLADGTRFMRTTEQMLAQGRMTKGEYYLADALQMMIEQGAHIVAREMAVWQDCGKPETVLETNRYLLGRGHANRPAGSAGSALIVPPVYVGEGAILEESVVGPYVTVGDGAVIRRSVIRDAIIGKDARVEDAILAGTLIGDAAVVCGRPHTLVIGDASQISFEGREE